MTKKFGINEQPSARRPVAWYSPTVLLQAGRELVSSMDFQRNLDRRESFKGPVFVTDLSNAVSPTEPFWFDFISDSGDSGNATYAVARAALAEKLAVDGVAKPLPTGQLLVLGGDLAYPGASPEEYQYRFLELYEKAKAEARIDTSNKVVVSIPQNHDWFDSLSTFCRYFVNRTGDFIGAITPQKQTYFAVKLPHNWWILGFDWALGGDIDRNQFEAFRALLGTQPGMMADSDDKCPPPQIEAGAHVVLLYPEPYWYRELGDGASIGYPKRYQRLEYLLEQGGARIAMRLAGDQHHYARDSMRAAPNASIPSDASHLVTCGSGGAFLHPTHCRDAQGIKSVDRSADTIAISAELQNRIRVGRDGSSADANARFDDERVRYPTPRATRVLALRNSYSMLKTNFSYPFPNTAVNFLAQLWDSNLGFAICLGLLYSFNAYVNSLVFSLSFIPDDFGPMTRFGFCDGAWQWLRAMVFSPIALIINLVMLGGCLRIAWEGPVNWWEKLISGVTHGLAHGFCVFALYWLASYIVEAYNLPSLCASIAIWAFITSTGILVGGLLFGCYFAVASAVFGQMPNNAFGSLAIQSYKGFMRFELTADKLHAYFIGIDCVNPKMQWDSPADKWSIKDEFDV